VAQKEYEQESALSMDGAVKILLSSSPPAPKRAFSVRRTPSKKVTKGNIGRPQHVRSFNQFYGTPEVPRLAPAFLNRLSTKKAGDLHGDTPPSRPILGGIIIPSHTPLKTPDTPYPAEEDDYDDDDVGWCPQRDTEFGGALVFALNVSNRMTLTRKSGSNLSNRF